MARLSFHTCPGVRGLVGLVLVLIRRLDLGLVIRKSARAQDTAATETPEQAEAWRDTMDQFFAHPRGGASACSKDVVKQFQKERLATGSNIFGLDDQILPSATCELMRFVGLSSFRERNTQLDFVDLHSEEPPFPMLSLGSDQGSDMFSFVFLLVHVLHMRTILIPDMCRRLPKDAKLAMREAAMWAFVLFMKPVCNLFWGPWETFGWAQEFLQCCAVSSFGQKRGWPYGMHRIKNRGRHRAQHARARSSPTSILFSGTPPLEHVCV